MADIEEKRFIVRFQKPCGNMATVTFPNEDQARDFMAKNPNSFLVKETITSPQGGGNEQN